MTPRAFAIARAALVRIEMSRRSCYVAPLLLGHERQDADGQTVDVRRTGDDEVIASLLEAEQPGRVTAQPVQLAYGQRCAVHAAHPQRLLELRAIGVILTRLNFGEVGDQGPFAAVEVVHDDLLLRFQPQAALPEADVVKHVTAFYTYMKVVRDSLRGLTHIKPPEPGCPRNNDWHRAICNVIFMQFLGLESARKAIKNLVEFEPTQAEDMITVLLSELLAYGFLREQFRGDIRERRLQARDAAYRKDIPALHRLVMTAQGRQWDAAKDLSTEMMKRFDRVLVDTPTIRAFKAVSAVSGIGSVPTTFGSTLVRSKQGDRDEHGNQGATSVSVSA